MGPLKLSPTIEDYLGIIFVLERDGEPIVGARLAELLDVSPPTVTNTLKRMVRDGLISMDEHKCIHLTQEGMKGARSVMRRHMLTEWMLVRMLSWSRVHAEAHDIEHAISDDVAAALQEQLSSPELCPHGNPFPGFEETVSDWVPLTEIQSGEQVIIRRIHEMAEENRDLLSFLEQKRVMPGHQGVIEEVLPFNQTITLCVDKQSVSLGFATARYIFVERVG